MFPDAFQYLSCVWGSKAVVSVGCDDDEVEGRGDGEVDLDQNVFGFLSCDIEAAEWQVLLQKQLADFAITRTTEPASKKRCA